MRSARPLIIALLVRCGSAIQLEASQCDYTKVFSLRSAWGSSDDPCHGKLPFDLWTLMKSEGSAQDSDAQHAREYCTQTQEVGLVELITPEGYAMSEGVTVAPGDVVSETKHASTYTGATAATFEAFCDDENISQVTRVTAVVEAHVSRKRQLGRRLKTSLSEAGQAHEVAELITGLQNLGCTRTTGEDQTVCVISDSFDQSGNAAALEASGDLPPVEVVKELPLDVQEGIDEGSAMLELMYDIASGSTYKFNTGFLGEQTFADDVNILNNEEGCDVIVDDIGIADDPAFRDGVISIAVDGVAESGNLYFSSAGNSGFGYRFESNFECASGFEAVFGEEFAVPACGTAVPSQVFQLDANDFTRYLYPITASAALEILYAHWDADIDTTEDILFAIYQEPVGSGQFSFFTGSNLVSGKAWEAVVFEPSLAIDGNPDPAFQYYLQIVHLGSEEKDIEGDFLLRSGVGGSGLGISGETDGSIYGHACASSCVAVGAIAWFEGDGPDGAFEDPETSPVEGFSARGPCIVNGETRSKPTTSAADGVSTSSLFSGLNPFFGTSAAAPVAAAIATIIRAACFPTVVGYPEIMDMLTNYEYTIDYTNDADGAAETWGVEAGHGIISATQMLAWVEANCAAACTEAGCDPDDETSCEGDLRCCREDRICKEPETFAADACGDPHMTGFHGQKFDFTGEDGSWYSLLSDSGAVHVNMRVTAPVAGRPDITYITGVSVLTTDFEGLEHSVVITVKDPHSLQSSCPTSSDGTVLPCLAEGALSVVVDGKEGSLLEPGTALLGPGVSVEAVNLPGACRSFGFEQYWERKKLDYAQAGRRLAESQSMGEWILGDPTVTNMEECIEYVARVVAGGSTDGFLNHQSEHASFRIVTPQATIRLSHGRLHQTATRDPTDTFELPDHLTWQMNVAIDQNDVSLKAKGVLGETIVPRRGLTGDIVMSGMEAIRGEASEYRVEGPLGVAFVQGVDHQQEETPGRSPARAI